MKNERQERLDLISKVFLALVGMGLVGGGVVILCCGQQTLFEWVVGLSSTAMGLKFLWAILQYYRAGKRT